MILRARGTVIYLTCTAAEERFIERMRRELAQRGYDLVTESPQNPSVHWVEFTYSSMAKSKYMLLTMSENPPRSTWAELETEIALSIHKSGEASLILLALDKCAVRKRIERIGGIVEVDFSGGVFDAPFERLCLLLGQPETIQSSAYPSEDGPEALRLLGQTERCNTETSKFEFTAFLSHSSEDKQKVAGLAARLKKAGISYWIDQEQIQFGDSVVSRIESGLQNSQFVVTCLSRNFSKSGWCRAEYGPILHREFSEKIRRVIPVLLDGEQGAAAVPLLLSDKLPVDLEDEDGFSRFLEFLRAHSER